MEQDSYAKDMTHYLDNVSVGVEIRGLHKSFGDNHVLRGLDLEITPGETLVILGRSGSGKSVLLKHIIGLLKPDAGTITIDGISIDDPELRNRHRLAMVFQSSALFNSMTVGENVALYLKEHDLYGTTEIERIVVRMLSIVGLEGLEAGAPSDLSGGMKKRVAIARALAMNPELILFDEPTAELDPMLTRTIGDQILDLRERMEVTQVVVTHDVEFAFYVAERLAILDEGKIVAIGAPEEIKNSQDSIVERFLRKI